MYKICLTILLTLPVAAYAQNIDGSSSSTSSSATAAGDNAGSVPDAPAMGSQQSFGRGMFFGSRPKEAPVGSFTVSGVYVFQTSSAERNRSLVGWSAVPEVNLTKNLGFQADFTSLYMMGVYPGQSRFLIAAGPRVNFAPRSKVTPFIFAEGGEMRSTTKANDRANWNPVAKGGVGFDYKVSRSLALQLVPGEYLGEYVEYRDNWNHSFSARAGIVFNLYR